MTEQEARELGWRDRSAAFAEWWNKADRACQHRAGVSLLDIGDADYAGMYEQGMSPAEAADHALKVNDFPFGED